MSNLEERQIDEQYIKTGVVRFGYLQFAVLGPESEWAAQASECAGDQQAFWPYHDKLYASQQGENQATYSKENLKSMAAALMLDVPAFNQRLDSSEYAVQVAQESNAGESLGVRATPTFLVNGRTLQGALPLAQFEQVIEEARGSARYGCLAVRRGTTCLKTRRTALVVAGPWV